MSTLRVLFIGDVVEGVGWIRGVEPPHNPGESDFRVRAFRNNQGGNISVAGNLKKIFARGKV